MQDRAAVDWAIPAQRRTTLQGASGNWMRRLMEGEMDVGLMRPFIGDDDRAYVTRNLMNPRTRQMEQHVVLMNDDTNATLRTLDWQQLDEAVIKSAKPRLGAARDLQERGLIYNLPNGIAKTSMQYQAISDISGATISMDGLRESESDRPVFSLLNFPIPIIHKDFQFPLRQVLESRTGYSPLDVTTAELAGRRVAEMVEQLTIGCGVNASFSAPGQLLGQSSYAWNNSAIYGYMNYPGRITYSITLPTSPGWIPQNTVDDVLQMIKASKTAFHTGPWMLYAGMYWDGYLDDDYKATYNDMTLRQRLREIAGILDIRTLDYIPDQSLILVQQSTDVVRMVIGMNITTIQWETHGGMQLNFKVMCCMVPQLRSDYYGNTGIVHGS